MVAMGDWRRLMDEGLVRRPRLGPPTPADLAAIWLRLSVRVRGEVRVMATARGIDIAEYMKERIAVGQAVLRGRLRPG